MNITKDNIIAQIVTEDYRTAAAFERFGIDFCCGGSRSIEAGCNQSGADAGAVINAVQQILDTRKSDSVAIDYASWPLDLLADYIEKKHHRYVTAQIPVINKFLDKITEVHGRAHPELGEIKTLFLQSAGELTMHMKKEELMLFPYIRKMVQAMQTGVNKRSPLFGTVQSPVNMMMLEHEAEGERFKKIATLSNNYRLPAFACNTYGSTFALLKEFEADLHLHIHLENNILFPGAIELEQSFQADDANKS